MKKFSELFRKYRLRAEFETIAAFSNALADKGYFYEESIFSHWQKGTRVPNNRKLVLTIISIFIEKEALTTIEHANEFLSSVGLGYLTEKEIQDLHLIKQTHSPFQVPSDIEHFSGRKEILEKIKKEIAHEKVFLLHGPAGVGKTALAVKLGHILRNRFPDGILWYKVDSSNVMDILLSISQLFGEDLHSIKDQAVRASAVRTLLESKKVLLIFDNVTSKDNIQLLLPNNTSSCVIVSSQENVFHTGIHHTTIQVDVFTQEEVLELFEAVFGKNYVVKYKKAILAIGEKLGNLPLALHIAAHVIATYPNKTQESLEAYLEQLDEQSLDLQTLTYEDKNLFRAITIGFETLDSKVKDVFISLGVFEGKDFSVEAAGFINKLSVQSTKKVLEHLHAISLIDASGQGRYRTHPLMKLFARKKMKDTSLYLQAAFYYEQLLNQAEKSHSYKMLTQETDNVIYIFKKCYDAGYWDQIITLWNPIEKFLSDTNEVKKLRLLTQTIDTAPSVNRLQKVISIYMIFFIVYWFILLGSGLKTSFWNYFFPFLLSLIPFVGGLVGIARSRTWGFLSTNIGKAIFFISAGLLSWGIGNLIWVYYNFFQDIDLPYPSLADVGFLLAGCLWIIGIVYFSKATNTNLNFRQKKSKLFLVLIPFGITVTSYYFLLFVSNVKFTFNEPLKLFFDLAYPSIDITILSLAIFIFSLSANFFRGKYKFSLFIILAGFVCMYISDFIFSYVTSINKYYNGGPADFPFSIALFLITWGTLSFYLTPKNKTRVY